MDKVELEENLLAGKALIKRMAQEFLEERLSIEASRENIRRLVAHIIVFEHEAETASKEKEHIGNKEDPCYERYQ